jgi:hypothetical protein
LVRSFLGTAEPTPVILARITSPPLGEGSALAAHRPSARPDAASTAGLIPRCAPAHRGARPDLKRRRSLCDRRCEVLKEGVGGFARRDSS